MKQQGMTEGNVKKQILRFSLPMIIGNVFQQSYNLVDSLIVGRYLGKEALAAVGASFPIIFVLISLIVGIANGSTIMISQFYGAKKYDKVKLTHSTLIIFLIAAALIISFTGITWTDYIFRAIQLPDDILPQASKYLKLYLCGLILFFIYNGITAVLRGVGDSKTPLYFLIVATILNIFFDILFIVVLHWDLESTALATIISQGIALVSCIIYLKRNNNLIQLKLKELKFDKRLYVQSLRIGFPSGMQSTFVSLGMMAVLSIVNTFGTSVVAAYTIALRLDSLAILPSMNFAVALSTFVGQNIGAEKIDRVKKGLIETLKLSSISSILIPSLFFLLGKQLVGLFTQDTQVIEIGYQYLIIVSAFYLLFSAMFSFNAVMKGAGDTLIPMFITLISLWIIRVPASYILSHYFGAIGIWWALPLTWLVGLILSFFYYKTGRWKRINILKH